MQKRTATISHSKATFTSTLVLPNPKTAFSFAPSNVPRTRLPMYNTSECSLPGLRLLDLPPPPFLSAFVARVYHPLLGRSCSVLSGFGFFSLVLLLAGSWVGVLWCGVVAVRFVPLEYYK